MQVENKPPYSEGVPCPTLSTIESGYRTTKARVDMLLKQQEEGTLVNVHQNYIDTWVDLQAHQAERLRRYLDEDWANDPVGFGLQNCFDNPPATLKRKNKNIFECGCPPELNPVCGLDGKSYSSSCMATCNGTDILKNETCPIKGPIYTISEAGSYSAPYFMTEAQQEALGGGNVGLESITEEEYQASVQNALTAYTAQGQNQAKSTTPSTTNTTNQQSNQASNKSLSTPVEERDMEVEEVAIQPEVSQQSVEVDIQERIEPIIERVQQVQQNVVDYASGEKQLTEEESTGVQNTAIIVLAIGLAVFIAMRIK